MKKVEKHKITQQDKFNKKRGKYDIHNVRFTWTTRSFQDDAKKDKLQKLER